MTPFLWSWDQLRASLASGGFGKYRMATASLPILCESIPSVVTSSTGTGTRTRSDRARASASAPAPAPLIPVSGRLHRTRPRK
jgi:hypothetical protein